MILWRGIGIACAGVVFLGGTVCAAQRPQGRVFTNEDIASPAPPPAPPAEASPSAPAAPAASQPDATAAAEPTGPEAEVRRLTAILMALGEASDEMDRKAQEATTVIDRNHYSSMRDCLANLLTDYRSFVDQAQAQVRAAQQAQ
ncbi:MAG: hypothetical protein HYX73_01885 [Acidobacteria bacterium]|nr:hypothetical protein [Acidobacteriota bacterium]